MKNKKTLIGPHRLPQLSKQQVRDLIGFIADNHKQFIRHPDDWCCASVCHILETAYDLTEELERRRRWYGEDESEAEDAN